MESWNQNPSSPPPEGASQQEFEQLRDQVALLTRRVATLERAAGLFSQSAAPLPTPAAAVERRIGLTTVNRVGAVTLALGILFFFKYAADNHWIGPLGRLLVGLIAGLCFVAFGERLRRSGQSALALGISGCGLAILYITAYAADEFYKILLPGASFVLMVCVVLLAGAIALRAASQSLAIVTILAACLVPALIPKVVSGPAILLYLAAVASAAIFIAVRERWSILPPATLVFGACLAFLSDNKTGAIAVFLLVHAAILFAARLRISEPPSLLGSLYVTGHAAILLAGLSLISNWVSPTSVALTLASVLLAIYGIGLLALSVSQRSNLNRLTGLSLIGLVIAKLYLYDIWLLSYGFRITAFVVLGALLLGASFVYSRWKANSTR